uniref:Uncharacterized protein n=1 Tax=Timema monikensis TaxID=170555 RepID=A0A7R9EE95_9NEOP|nr:unnamed protein product [Timema monikensis]
MLEGQCLVSMSGPCLGPDAVMANTPTGTVSVNQSAAFPSSPHVDTCYSAVGREVARSVSKVLKQAPLLRAMHRMNPQQHVALLKMADKKLIGSVWECAVER